ncbi:hypothetical protein EVA_06629 [gut metagenome]|uniref:Uncharacterized protein n=1 Tax=gut metagenome TaxID=749906 RepID=J9GRR7_9ZZZZ
METNFIYNESAKPEPVRIEQVFAEKPGGGRVVNSPFDIPATTAVGRNEAGKLAPIKAYRLVKAVNAGDTTIEIEKGSGVAVGDFIANGKKAVKCTKVESKPDKDIVTVSLGLTIKVGTALYQAKAEDASAAEPIYQPEFVTGNTIPANNGDTMVRLINGANLRKETANIANEVAALLPTIQLV